MLLFAHLHPLFFATGALVLTACAATLYTPLIAFCIVATYIITVCFAYKNESRWITFWLSICVAIATSCNMFLHKQRMLRAHELLTHKQWICSGTLISKEQVDHMALRYCYQIAAKKVENATNNHPITGVIVVYSNRDCDVQVGDEIITSMLRCGREPSQEKLLFALKNNVIMTLFDATATVRCTHRPVVSLQRIASSLKNRIVASIKTKMSADLFALFSSIFLGKAGILQSNSCKDSFSKWGLAHFLARSGLHLVIFLWLWQALFNYVPIHMCYKKPLLITIVVLYWLLSWSSISFLRALVSWIIGAFSWWLMRPTSPIAIFTATCFIITLINPFVIFFLDFQLSFCLTLALLLFSASPNKAV